jgi:hypothetical protein
MPSNCSRAITLGLAVVLSSTAHAQGPDYLGLNGSIMFGMASWEVGDSSYSTRFAGGLTLGYRFGVPGFRWLTLTPHGALTMTRFAGIRLGSNQIAFSRVELGLQAAAHVGPLSPYAMWRRGRGTMERMVGDEAANFYGPGSGWGGGIEIPLHNDCANAIDLAWHRSVGSFDNVETRRDLVQPRMAYRSRFVTVGWSGRFRGTRFLFACW